jgi:hypothetical protein
MFQPEIVRRGSLSAVEGPRVITDPLTEIAYHHPGERCPCEPTEHHVEDRAGHGVCLPLENLDPSVVIRNLR